MTAPQRQSTMDTCMKCGFCMSVCPVYSVDQLESHVARGRNALIKKAFRDELPADASYRDSLSSCLLCGRCGSVCAARVDSPAINVAARTRLIRAHGVALWQRLLYRGLLRRRTLMARVMGLARLLPGISSREGTPLRHLANLAALRTTSMSLPPLSNKFLSRRLPLRTLPPAAVPRRSEVAFFSGCGLEFFFAEAGHDAVRTLAAAGFEVVHPADQGCCGLAVRGAGDEETARAMARAVIDQFSRYERIVCACATCGSALRSYGAWFDAQDPYRQQGDDLARRIVDYSALLAASGAAASRAAAPVRVTYHDPCHMKWHHDLSRAPRELLQGIAGVTYVEMAGADNCCGLGGSFGLTHRKTSIAIQAKKMASIRESGAQVVVTSCPGCLLQLQDGVNRHGLAVKVMHISRFLRQYAGDRSGKEEMS